MTPPRPRTTTLPLLVVLLILLAACQTNPPAPTNPPATPPRTTQPASQPPTQAPTPSSTPVIEPPVLPIDIFGTGTLTPTVSLNTLTLFGYTYQQPDGNRFVEGQGNLLNLEATVIPLEGLPRWVVGGPIDGNGSIWAVVLEDGRVQGFMLLEGRLAPLDIFPQQLAPGQPPLLIIDRGVPSLVTAPSPQASTLTHPVVLSVDPLRMAFIENNGDLVLWENGEIGRLALNALPDARILQDENDRLLLLTDATTRYTHAVLGDDLEAGSISLVATNPALELVWTLPLPDNRVVEGIAPIWTDLDGNGEREIIVTASDEENGAQILLFDEQGEQIAAGPAIGRGFRWRHQLLAAPFGPAGKNYLVDVLTPHIGGVVEFYQWVEDRLDILAELPGYSSHKIGSRNFDMALAGDLDGDAAVELLVPNNEMDALGALRLANRNITLDWEIQLESLLTTNLSAVTLQDGSIAIAMGVDDNRLLIWSP